MSSGNLPEPFRDAAFEWVTYGGYLRDRLMANIVSLTELLTGANLRHSSFDHGSEASGIKVSKTWDPCSNEVGLDGSTVRPQYGPSAINAM